MSRRGGTMALLLALLLLAWGARLYQLDTQSLWADEGNSVAMAPRPPLEILQRTANDIHPPLYYLLLSGWVQLVGDSVFAVRSLSAIFGVLTVAVTARLARYFFPSVPAILFATYLAALSPFALYYSQETRMYSLAMLVGALSWALWWRWMQRPTGGRALVYGLVSLALLYTHYYTAAVVVAQNLAWLIGWLYLRTRPAQTNSNRSKQLRLPSLMAWAGTQLTLLLLYLPWLWVARNTILNWPAISPPLAPATISYEIFRIFSLGLANEGMSLGAILLFGGLAVAGLIAAARRWGGVVMLLYLLVPPVLMLLLSLNRPFWNPKFLLVALPAYHLLLGSALSIIKGRWQWATLPLIMGLSLFTLTPALDAMWYNPRYWRDDYAGMVRTISAQAGPNDAILLDGPGQREVFSYYYDGPLPVYGLPTQQPVDEEAAAQELARIATQYDRLWVLWWAEQDSDPELVIPLWLDTYAFEAGSRWYGNVRLARYRLGEPPAPAPVNVSFSESGGGTLHLAAAGVEPSQVVAGELVALNSEWALRTPLNAPITFFAQLLDDGNHVIGQYDGDGGAPPVAAWQTNTSMPVRFAIPVPVGTIPGTYRLIMGAYRSDTGQRLTTPDGDTFALPPVTVSLPVVPPIVDALELPYGAAQNTAVGPLALVGARVNKLGFDHAPDTPIAPGEPLAVVLYWQVRDPMPSLSTSVEVVLRDRAGYEIPGGALTILPPPATPIEWRAGDLIREPHTLFLPTDLVSGTYRVIVAGADIGQIEVK